MLRVDMNGLYWPSDHVRRILAPRPDGVEPPAVLDIGTGSGEHRFHRLCLLSLWYSGMKLGSWVIGVAKEFPHTQVVGLDLALPTFAE